MRRSTGNGMATIGMTTTIITIVATITMTKCQPCLQFLTHADHLG